MKFPRKSSRFSICNKVKMARDFDHMYKFVLVGNAGTCLVISLIVNIE